MASKALTISDILKKYDTKKTYDFTTTGSICLDKMLGGGLAPGQMYAMWGVSGCGKSTIACQTAKQFCKLGKKVIYVDVEKALNTNQLRDFGLEQYTEDGSFNVITINNYNELSEVVVAVAKEKACDLFIVDSVSEIMPVANMEELDVVSARPGQNARQGGLALQQMHSLFYDNGITSIVLFHARANISMGPANPYQETEVMGGGYQSKHIPDVIIKVSASTKLKSDDDQDILGQVLAVTTQKNKFAPPLKKFKVKMFYGKGISRVAEVIDLALDLNIITRSGAYYSLPNGDKVCGEKKLYAIEDDAVLDDLRNKVLEAMNSSEE